MNHCFVQLHYAPQDYGRNGCLGQSPQGLPVEHLLPKLEHDHLRSFNFGGLKGSDSFCNQFITQGVKSPLEQLCAQRGPGPLLMVNDPYDRLSSSPCQS
jgi:hypothetical protein